MAKFTKQLEIESLPKLLYNLTETSSENDFLAQSKILSDLKISEPYSKYYPKFNLPFKISEPTSINRTIDSGLVFYTAVPKTGSTFLTLILLENPNIFVTSQKILPMKRIPKGKSLIEDIKWFADSYVKHKKWNVNLVSIEHRCFFNVETFNVPIKYKPIWIGSVRDPIDRFASLYYFKMKPRKYKINPFRLV